MSWDVLVLNYHGSPPADIDEMAAAPEPHPLGAAKSVRNAISQHLDFVDWSDPRWGICFTDKYSIEFNVGNEERLEALQK